MTILFLRALFPDGPTCHVIQMNCRQRSTLKPADPDYCLIHIHVLKIVTKKAQGQEIQENPKPTCRWQAAGETDGVFG